jgi:predicted nucleic acid-binding protein
MKVILDTNIYIEWIRQRAHSQLMLDCDSRRYLSSVVLMELWAGARTRAAGRTVERLASPYVRAERVVPVRGDDWVAAGQLMADLEHEHRPRLREASFVNDILIALSARSIGATLYTRNRADYEIIGGRIKGLRMEFVEPPTTAS